MQCFSCKLQIFVATYAMITFQKTHDVSASAFTIVATQLVLVHRCSGHTGALPGHTTGLYIHLEDAAESFRDVIEWRPTCIWESELWKR